jgi:hypothetical protein
MGMLLNVAGSLARVESGLHRDAPKIFAPHKLSSDARKASSRDRRAGKSTVFHRRRLAQGLRSTSLWAAEVTAP